MTDSDYWARYYEVTAERPAWPTVRRAIELFAAESPPRPRLAVDLGCGAGRDARELLGAGWRVIAIDRERAAIDVVEAATAASLRVALEGRVAYLAEIDGHPCDLVDASLSLSFLPPAAFWATWERIVAALPVGGRIAAMLFGDRDQSAAEIRARLGSFEIEHWDDREEDTQTALGEPHHFHLVELVARRVAPG